MKEPPNILWIVTTQWRASATGYSGDANARTPWLDALAAKSVNYAQAVTPHPFGPFARAAMFTGVPSPQNGVSDYFDPLPIDAQTIAHRLRERGYHTAFFGKWHLAKRDPRAALVGEAHAKIVVPPEERGGFEFWEGFESGFQLNDPWLHGTRLPEPQKFPGYQSEVVTERAADWLRERGTPNAEYPTSNAQLPTANPVLVGATEEGGKPWFSVVSLEAPHPPYDAQAAEIAPRSAEKISLAANVPRGGATEVKTRQELAGYYAQIEATDRAIGRLIAAVDADAANRGQRAPLVVFTSVHGDMHGAQGLFRKGWPYEESVRVPLLVRLPDEFDSGFGVSSSELVSLLDLSAMTLKWAEGTNLTIEASKLETRNSKLETDFSFQRISMPSVVALPHQCDRIWRGVRTNTRKLILDEEDEPWLFFDLEQDPLEMKNLVGDPAWAGEIARWRARAIA